MADIKTIDTRIRDRSDAALRDKIKHALEAARSLCRVGYPINTDVKIGAAPQSLMDLIGIIEAKLFEHHQSKFQEIALVSFLEKIEAIQGEVDELRATIDH